MLCAISALIVHILSNPQNHLLYLLIFQPFLPEILSPDCSTSAQSTKKGSAKTGAAEEEHSPTFYLRLHTTLISPVLKTQYALLLRLSYNTKYNDFFQKIKNYFNFFFSPLTPYHLTPLIKCSTFFKKNNFLMINLP